MIFSTNFDTLFSIQEMKKFKVKQLMTINVVIANVVLKTKSKLLNFFITFKFISPSSHDVLLVKSLRPIFV